MGYNKTKFAVKRNQPQLDQLMIATGPILFPSDRPHRLAEKLREALNASWHFEEFKHYYNALHHKWRFRILDNGVLAEPKQDDAIGEALVKEGVIERGDLDHDEYPPREKDISPKAPDRKVMNEAASLLDVFAICLRFPNDLEINFPNVILSEEDKLKLFSWTCDSEHRWKYIDQGSNGLTLTKRDDVPLEILWRKEA